MSIYLGSLLKKSDEKKVGASKSYADFTQKPCALSRIKLFFGRFYRFFQRFAFRFCSQ
jgi:hypothetical protein